VIAGQYARREDSRVKGVFEKYLLALRKTPLDEHTEHTGRTALETLLQAIADEADTGIRVQHEPKRQADKGAPDFKVSKSGLILGYIENKGIDENLNKVLKSEQIKRYLSLSKKRWTYYTGKPSGFHVRPRRAISDSMLNENVAIISNRSQEIPGEWSNVLVTSQPASHHSVSNKEVNTVFPTWRFDERSREENLSPELRTFIDERYDHHYTPEEILGYIYAVLHARTYRTRYADFLRIDFPRIPFPETKAEFDALSKLGWALVQAHLLRRFPRQGLAQYGGKGNHVVEAVRYDPEQAVWINDTQLFVPVPQAVWDFQIGGYQVLDKYLKSRKGRKLSLEEINHVAAVANALAFTIEQMAKIDEGYRTAFPDRG
jgi:hypothetical protein